MSSVVAMRTISAAMSPAEAPTQTTGKFFSSKAVGYAPLAASVGAGA